jgi:hypothetical protein
MKEKKKIKSLIVDIWAINGSVYKVNGKWFMKMQVETVNHVKLTSQLPILTA